MLVVAGYSVAGLACSLFATGGTDSIKITSVLFVGCGKCA